VRPQSRRTDRELARLATEAHGVVTRAALLRAGVTVAEIKERLGKGTLIPVHRGVYRVGHCAPSIEASYLAAVRACGEGALLCGRSAAHLLGILKGAPPPPEVVAATEHRVPGICTRRSRGIDRRDAVTLRAIPVTTVPYTLTDLAAVLALDHLARACHEAGVRYRTTPADVEAVLARRGAVRGAGKLRRVLHGEVPVTLSRLELEFLRLLDKARLPLPQTNRLAGGRRVDCRWPEYRLTVELDSYRYHHSRHAWEQDRRREQEARARDDQFRRYSYGDVLEHPRVMLNELRTLLRPPS